MTGTEIILLCIAAYFASFALIMNTKNFRSAVIFKVIPLFASVFLVLLAFRLV